MTKFVAVGFKVNKDRSIFYFKKDSLDSFMDVLEGKIVANNPDFVSLRMVKEEAH